MRKILFVFLFSGYCLFANAQSSQQKPPTPEDVCGATLGFMNQLGSGEMFKKILGTVSKEPGSRIESREYNSLFNFPGAQKTIIIDTNGVNHYRSAKVLMFSETVSDRKMMKNATTVFDFISDKLMKPCLEKEKFEADYSVPQTPLHILRMVYVFKMPSNNGSPFATLQGGNTLAVEIDIDQTKNGDNYTNEVYLLFKRF